MFHDVAKGALAVDTGAKKPAWHGLARQNIGSNVTSFAPGTTAAPPN